MPSSVVASAEEIIALAAKGEMFILVDHEDRENEGDLIILGEFADAQAINFMAKYGRGLICLALSGEQLDKLGLDLMSAANQSRLETAFTTSIEAREGVSTGISAHDRAKTVSVAINPQSTNNDIATPGHIFPLRAREGGVLVRAGHTEAAVDIARLAGMKPSGVICEVMNDDGTMARFSDLEKFATEHGLKIGTIADLIAFRRRNDNLVHCVTNNTLDTGEFGQWDARIYSDKINGSEHLVLSFGDIAKSASTLVRMHQFHMMHDLEILHAGENGTIRKCMRKIHATGVGVIVLLGGSVQMPLSQQILGRDTTKDEHVPDASDALREYGIGAQILAALGLCEITLMTNNPRRIVGLSGYGLQINDTMRID